MKHFKFIKNTILNNRILNNRAVANLLIRKSLSIALATIFLVGSSFSYANTDQLYASNVEKFETASITTTADIKTTQLNLHTNWQNLLQKHIKTVNDGASTEVDYAGIKKQRSMLQYYLKQLSQISRIEFDTWSKPKQLAFLINAYNAWTVEFILTEYPNIESIKDLGSFFSSPWDKKFIPLLGQKLSLNNIEHGLIRGSDRYNDPRIHFAVNCASIGCPALLEEAYTEQKIEQQLTQQTERFLTDTSRNYIKGDDLNLSSIFKWYGDDFEVGFRGSKSIQSFILLYSKALNLSDAQQAALAKQSFDIDFLDYNWKLNDTNE